MRLNDITFCSGMPDPKMVVECSSLKCDKHFHLADGWAFPGHSLGEETVHLFFFCSPLCYLDALPKEACWRC